MNLHLLKDEKFTDGAIAQFEKFYPDQNVFIINTKDVDLRYVKSNNCLLYNLEKKSDVKKIIGLCREKQIENVFVHFLDYFTAGIATLLGNKYKYLVFYWVFFGADLYNTLNREFKYPLYDKVGISKTTNTRTSRNRFKPLIKLIKNKLTYLNIYKKEGLQNYTDFITHLDYFCFWNIKDFELMRKYFKTNAQFKYFYYENALQAASIPKDSFATTKIMVNNSASPVGNHIYILKKIISLVRPSDEIILPLNYGSEAVKSKVSNYIKSENLTSITTIKEFLRKDKYFELLSDVSVAFFGARRQHAGGNIFQLLANGTKVFLRNDNNMLALLKGWGFKVFSFEDDFKSSADLQELPFEAKMVNFNIFKEKFNHKIVEEFMVNLINKR